MSAAQSVEPYTLRSGRASDHNLVLNSWIKSHRRNAFGGQLDDESYIKGQEWLVKSLLERCALIVAAYDADPDYVMGWAVTSTGSVHYCWVRHAFRRKGIARALLRPYLDKPTTYTHRIAIGADWMAGKTDKIPASWVFDPYHAFRIAAYPRATHA